MVWFFFFFLLQSDVAEDAAQKDAAVVAADKEELKNALISAQESAAIQLLLEACIFASTVKSFVF